MHISLIVSVALCFMMSSPVAAQVASFYGRANVSFELVDDGDKHNTQLESNSSRLGVKGGHTFDNNIRVFYELEWDVDLSELTGPDTTNFRDQYIGVSGSLGTVYLGRKDSSTKIYSQNVDLFNDYKGDLKFLWRGESRLKESFAYESIKLNGFQFGISYKLKRHDEERDGVSIGLRYGDVKLKASKWNAALAMDSDINGYDVLRASIQAMVGDMKVSAMVHHQDQIHVKNDKTGFLVSVQYAIKQWKLKTQYQSLGDNGGASLGADYQLGKATKAYTWFTLRALDESKNKSYLAVGMEHRF